MHRRALLASFAAGVAGLAGCTSGDTDQPATGSSPTNSPTATRSPTPTPWDSPGPTAESRFEGRSVPPIDDRRSIQWYHEADESTVAFVRPSTERLELDGTVEFEVINHSTTRLQCGHWNLYKLVDGQWFHVGPFVHTSDCRRLEPGDTKQWTLQAFNGATPSAGGGPGTHHDGLSQGYLGGGTYATVAGYGHPEDESGALVDLVGDAVELEPVPNLPVERSGGTVTVTLPEYRGDEPPEDASFSLTKTGEADERLVAEQLMSAGQYRPGFRAIRAGLALWDEDTERVEVRADVTLVDRATGHDSDSRRFRFRDQAYLVVPTEQ